MVQNEKNPTLNRIVMEFDSNKPIFLQIADSFHEKILSGELKPGDRIMSVRELGGELGVNPNTVMRSYEKMTASGIIYNKRGIGYFISDDARNIVEELQREDFLKNEVPKIKKKMQLLGLDSSIFNS